MHIERLLVAFSIATVVFALTYAGSAAIGAQRERPTPAVARPLDANALTKKLDLLAGRLREAQTSIDDVLIELASVDADSERDATRVRLDVLFRLERGLSADIERTRDELARVGSR